MDKEDEKQTLTYQADNSFRPSVDAVPAVSHATLADASLNANTMFGVEGRRPAVAAGIPRWEDAEDDVPDDWNDDDYLEPEETWHVEDPIPPPGYYPPDYDDWNEQEVIEARDRELGVNRGSGSAAGLSTAAQPRRRPRAPEVAESSDHQTVGGSDTSGDAPTRSLVYWPETPNANLGITNIDVTDAFIKDTPHDEEGETRFGTLSIVSASTLLAKLPKPREWVLGTFALIGAVSLLVGAPGAGKTIYALCLACAVAAGRSWGGDTVPRARPVIIVSAEDCRDEVTRRLAAIVQVLELDDAASKNIHIIAGQSFRVGGADGDRRELQSVMWNLISAIDAIGAGLVIIDPLVEVSGCDENSNDGMHRVMADLRFIAQRGNCSVVVVHHSGKSSDSPGNQNASRGASAVVGAVRAMRTLVPLDEDDAGTFGVQIDEVREHIRVDGAKSNYARLEGVALFKKLSVNLTNGDDVGILVPADIVPAPEIESRGHPKASKSSIAEAAAGMFDGRISVNKLAGLLLQDRADLFPGVACSDPTRPSGPVRKQIISAIQAYPICGPWTMVIYETDGPGGNGKVVMVEKASVDTGQST